MKEKRAWDRGDDVAVAAFAVLLCVNLALLVFGPVLCLASVATGKVGAREAENFLCNWLMWPALGALLLLLVLYNLVRGPAEMPHEREERLRRERKH